MSDVKRITHHINGAYWTGKAERSGDVYNPATPAEFHICLKVLIPKEPQQVSMSTPYVNHLE